METIELTNIAKKVLTVIDGTGPDAINWKTIQVITKMERMLVFSGLLELELYGIIKQLPGKYFVKKGAA